MEVKACDRRNCAGGSFCCGDLPKQGDQRQQTSSLGTGSFKRIRKRIRHALDLRWKEMAASVSHRKRPRGNEKQKMVDLAEDVLTRLFVTKKLLPEPLVKLAIKSDNKRLLARLVNAHVRGVNPLIDGIGFWILACFDQLDPIFSRPFYCLAYVHKKLPGLSKWRDAAAATFVAFVEGKPKLLSLRVPKEDPNWRAYRRPYQFYKKRRQNLGAHPHKHPVITAAHWDQNGDVLYVASETDGWGWEICRFIPRQNQRD